MNQTGDEHGINEVREISEGKVAQQILQFHELGGR
jgi:hypothetical protein